MCPVIFATWVICEMQQAIISLVGHFGSSLHAAELKAIQDSVGEAGCQQLAVTSARNALSYT